MSDLQKEYIQKIKRGEVGVRVLNNCFHYPFIYRTVTHIEHANIVIVKLPETPAISFSTNSEKVEMQATIYMKNSDCVKKMFKLLDKLIEAIELEDYQTFKSTKDAIDELDP